MILGIIAENRLSEFLTEALRLRIRCGSKTLGKLEEGPFFSLYGLETFFDEFNQQMEFQAISRLEGMLDAKAFFQQVSKTRRRPVATSLRLT